MIALVDCNNFFASCEQAFNPKYRSQPLVVLSNNDGCVIARSKEAKTLGIPMGAPIFEHEQLILKHNIITLSANFTLYGDMSSRVMEILSSYGFPIEVYSIDEAFLQIDSGDLEHIAKDMTRKVQQWLGLPIAVGIAPTKTLAKIASQLAKRRGVPCVFQDVDEMDKILEEFPIEEVWGIGRQTCKKLAAYRIRTVADFIRRDEDWIRKKLSITGLRTLLELKGKQAIGWDDHPEPQKSLVVSRSFPRKVSAIQELKESIANHLARAGEKLRKGGLKASYLSVFLISKSYHARQVKLIVSTNYTPDLIAAANSLIDELFVEGTLYRKSGITLYPLEDAHTLQGDLFHTIDPKQKRLMGVVDRINQQFGKNSLFIAAQGVKREWQFRPKKRSDLYTTSWDELLKIRKIT